MSETDSMGPDGARMRELLREVRKRLQAKAGRGGAQAVVRKLDLGPKDREIFCASNDLTSAQHEYDMTEKAYLAAKANFERAKERLERRQARFLQLVGN